MAKQNLGNTKKKFSLREFIWHGFNYTVGIGFIGVIGVLGNGKAFTSDGGIGLNTLWILLMEGLVAGTIAWAFAKMARIYKSSQNGGAYIFVRGTFGKFLGIFVAFMLYVGMPFMITNQVMMLIKGTFSPSFVANIDGAPAWFVLDWGSFGDLYLDLIGISIYLGSAFIIFGGIKLYKRMANTTAFIKWGAALFLILAAIIMTFVDAFNGKDNSNIVHWANDTHFDLSKIMSTFSTCFYFFAGFEIFSTAGQNVENPNRNIGLGVTLIMIISTIFYIVIMVFFFCSITPNAFSQNASMSAWNTWFGDGPASVHWLYFLGPVLIIVSSIALKINAAMQNSLYGGTALQPLCVEGYFPQSLGKLNKDGLPTKASTVNLVIVGIFIFIWLAIPDIIKGIQCDGHLVDPNDINTPLPDPTRSVPDYWIYKDAFNVATLTEASAVVTIFVYSLVLASVLTMSGSKNKLKLQLWETIAFNIALIFLAVLFVFHYYTVINRIVEGLQLKESGQVVGGVVEIGFVVVAAVFASIWYKTYYKRVVERRNLTDAKIQMALDKEFELIDVVADEYNRSPLGI